jgi:hypothetical protein
MEARDVLNKCLTLLMNEGNRCGDLQDEIRAAISQAEGCPGCAGGTAIFCKEHSPLRDAERTTALTEDKKRMLMKIRDVLREAREFHELRDQMNARLHCARETRYSPLTVRLQTANDELDLLIKE